MLFTARRDHASLKKGNHIDLKSVIVSIGVLGTFVGIALGLWEFDTKNIDQSVPKLLEGLKLAFMTSIAGMVISIFLSTIQRDEISGGDDEIAILKSINEKLTGLNSLKDIDTQISGLRVDLRDELHKNSTTIESGFTQLKLEAQSISETLQSIPKTEHINQFRNEIHQEQVALRNFLQEQFLETNDTLKHAIEYLSKGATEEIIKALEKVIADFNKNLTEQFGENFKELNMAVLNLLEWQKQHKEIIEKDGTLLNEIRASISQTSQTLEKISQRNNEVQNTFEQLKSLITTYDNQVSALNTHLETYGKMGSEAAKAFETLSNGFESVQKGMGAQSEAIANLTKEISTQLPESLGELESTLVGLTTQFGKDYQSFLENYKKLVA